MNRNHHADDHPLSRELSVAVQAVRKACLLCREVRQQLVSTDALNKQDRSPVTVADFGSQAVINHSLRTAFPGDPIVAEEDASVLRGQSGAAEIRARVVEHVRNLDPSLGEGEILDAIDAGKHQGGAQGRFWTLDPIDGTKGFLRGDQYAVALALIEDGQVVLGVLGCPNMPVVPGDPAQRGVVFMALRGAGARTTELEGDGWQPINVSGERDPRQARFCESVESGHSSHSDSAAVARLLGIEQAPLRIDSQAKYAAVARGEASIYLRLPARRGYEEKIWDHAAGWIIVQEAGGTVTDVHGHALDFSQGRTLRANTGVIATNGWLHNAVLQAVSRVLS